ncbi:hypothetical protein JKP88DRAFT_349485 [Tribonema minus]|uniref:Uncharacterized protein n=1 Tax=Tribonema minus TaxID=303371 RepID=A0A835YUZ7_9STRA|nr:hypothetical protein JKP88DRAFT_349485 [Tribonema minus]
MVSSKARSVVLLVLAALAEVQGFASTCTVGSVGTRQHHSVASAGRLTCSTIGQRGSQRRTSGLCMASDDSAPFEARLLACFPYILPVLDGVGSGRNVYAAVPAVGEAVYGVLGPALAIWNGVPFLGFGVFLAFTFAARNTELSRLVRFSLQQAILIDIALIVLGLLENVTKAVAPGGADVFATLQFYILISAVAYSLVSNLQGKEPNEIPIISEAAQRQIGPF